MRPKYLKVGLLSTETTQTSPLLATKSIFSRVFQTILRELTPFRQTLLSRWFWLMFVVCTFLFCLAYQFPFTRIIDLDSTRDKPLLVDYYATERYQNFVYRWTQPNSNIILAGVGQVPTAKIRLELSPRPENTPPPDLIVSVNSAKVATFNVNKPTSFYQLDYFPAQRSFFSINKSELNIWLKIDPLLVKNDKRPLGIVVSGIEIQAGGLFDTGRFTIPDWQLLFMTWGVLVLLFGLGLKIGWSPVFCMLGGVILELILAVGLILERPTTALAIPLILEASLLVYPLTIAGLWLTRVWLRKKGLAFDGKSAQWLGIIFVLAFIIRIVGLNHPSFQTLDHGFRIHEVAAINQQPSYIFSHYYNVNSFESVTGEANRSVTAGQWKLQVTIPYTPLFYIVDQPIAWLTNLNEQQLLHWTNIFAAWLDVSALFFLYLIARFALGRYGKVAGQLGSLLYCFFPLSFLMSSDGGYNTILATWLTLWWMALITGWFHSAKASSDTPSWKRVLAGGILLTLVFLAHTATLLLVATFSIVYFGLLSFWSSTEYRGLVKRCWVMFGIGLGLSFGCYYGFYLVSFIQTTLPTILNTLGEGKGIGKESLRGRGFWDNLGSHFHLFPVLATVGIIGWLFFLYLFSKKPDAQHQNYRQTVKSEISIPGLYLLVAWLATFLIFSLIATQINLLQKEMLFALPLFALGTGLTLAILVDFLRTRAESSPKKSLRINWAIATLLISAVALWFLAAGSYTWYIRAINYVLPAGTG